MESEALNDSRSFCGEPSGREAIGRNIKYMTVPYKPVTFSLGVGRGCSTGLDDGRVVGGGFGVGRVGRVGFSVLGGVVVVLRGGGGVGEAVEDCEVERGDEPGAVMVSCGGDNVFFRESGTER